MFYFYSPRIIHSLADKNMAAVGGRVRMFGQLSGMPETISPIT